MKQNISYEIWITWMMNISLIYKMQKNIKTAKLRQVLITVDLCFW